MSDKESLEPEVELQPLSNEDIELDIGQLEPLQSLLDSRGWDIFLNQILAYYEKRLTELMLRHDDKDKLIQTVAQIKTLRSIPNQAKNWVQAIKEKQSD